jgi:hypothetical protein
MPILDSRADVFAPITCYLADMSFIEGVLPWSYKTAQILPLLKQPGLDQSVSANYRRILNLYTVSKTRERQALGRHKPHRLDTKSFIPLWSELRYP